MFAKSGPYCASGKFSFLNKFFQSNIWNISLRLNYVLFIKKLLTYWTAEATLPPLSWSATRRRSVIITSKTKRIRRRKDVRRPQVERPAEVHKAARQRPSPPRRRPWVIDAKAAKNPKTMTSTQGTNVGMIPERKRSPKHCRFLTQTVSFTSLIYVLVSCGIAVHAWLIFLQWGW